LTREEITAASRTLCVPAMMRIVEGDLGDSRVVDLLYIHVTSARAETAPGSAHALDLTALQSPDISFWTIWER
jgi:putative acetyltransferase